MIENSNKPSKDVIGNLLSVFRFDINISTLELWLMRIILWSFVISRIHDMFNHA